MAIPAITNNSPGPGQISWAEFHIQYQGVSYTVAAGSTAGRWVWWRFNGGSPVIENGNTVPSNLTDDDLVLFSNKNGIGLRVQTSSMVDGELLVDGSIFADAIAANNINTNHIVTAGLDAAVIKFGTMSGERIQADSITSAQIKAGSIVADDIAAGAVTAEKLQAGAVTTESLAAGAITAEKIAAGVLSAQQIDVDALTADILNTGLIQSQLSITGMLNIAETNQAWSAEGLVLGNGTVFYPDDRTNQIEGALVTDSITVQDGLSIAGNADLRGTLVINNGLASPSRAPSLSQTWPKRHGTTIGAVGGSGENGQYNDESNTFHGLVSLDADNWGLLLNFGGITLRRFKKSDLSWNGDYPLKPGVSGNSVDGLIPLSNFTMGTGQNELYFVALDGRKINNTSPKYLPVLVRCYLYSNLEFHSIESLPELPYTFLENRRVRIATGTGAGIGIFWTDPKNGNLMFMNKAITPTSTAGVAPRILAERVGYGHVGGAVWMAPESKYLVSMYNGDNNWIRSIRVDGSIPWTDAPRANNTTVIGMGYDPTTQSLYHVDRQGFFHEYSGFTSATSVAAEYTFYDGDASAYPLGTVINGVDVSGQPSGEHETPPSPRAFYNLSARAWPVITTPPAPDELSTDASRVDKADRIGIYASTSATVSGNVPQFQTYLPKGTRTLPLTKAFLRNTYPSAQTPKPSFATAAIPSPGELRSDKKLADGFTPQFLVRGDASGNWGDLVITPAGKASIGGDSGWVNLILLNSWTNYGAPYRTAQYRKIGNAIYLKGLVKGGGTAPLGSLPIGFRPPGDIILPAVFAAHTWDAVGDAAKTVTTGDPKNSTAAHRHDVTITAYDIATTVSNYGGRLTLSSSGAIVPAHDPGEWVSLEGIVFFVD